MKKILAILLVLGGLILVKPALAMDCYQDPIYDKDLKGEVKSAVWVRDNACTTGTNVVATLTAGQVVKITGYTDGWYRVVTPDGKTGWSGETFFTLTDKELTCNCTVNTNTTPTTQTATTTTTPTSTVTSASLVSRLKGYILLQVQQHGEAYYVNPTDGYRYYMKDGPTAYEMLRKFGLGITDSDLNKVLAGDSALVSRLKGRILLQVQQHGEAYYINPKDGKSTYMKDGPAAYSIMRYLSLGITDADLAKIPLKEFVPVSYNNTTTTSSSTTTPTNTNTSTTTSSNYSEITLSSYQKGTIPVGVDLITLNNYWLTEINKLRAAAGLRQLVLDQRFVDTSTEWAGYMGENDLLTHTRPDGSTMHQWIGTKNLDWTTRYSSGGWTTNYFTENIAWNIADGNNASIEQAMDETIDWMLAEGASGAHYKTIYHVDWNTVGVGFYFRPYGDGQYKVYMAYHYGSLNY